MIFLFFNPPLWSMRFIYFPFNPVFGALLAVLRGSIQESRCQSASKCLKEIRKCKVADWTQICWLYAKLTTLNNFLRPKSVKKNLSVCISAAEIDLIIKPRAYQTVAEDLLKPFKDPFPPYTCAFWLIASICFPSTTIQMFKGCLPTHTLAALLNW